MAITYPAPITPAQLNWRDSRTPEASAYGDLYFSADDGLAESRYVFLEHNGLPQRWAEHQAPRFVVVETGFGTGLNFLNLWQAHRQWRQTHAKAPRLHFVSVEKHPLTRADHQHALAAWPQLAELAPHLLDALPLAVPGMHRCQFDDGQVVLDLYYGELDTLLDDWAGAPVDAWFLDGFAPALNPQMWSERLFQWMANHSHAGTSIATFTAVGHIRRSLQQVGFLMRKVPGFGRKREMLCGQFGQPSCVHLPQPLNSALPIAVIGAGIGGACLAYALAQRGYQVTVLHDGKQVASGASGNRQGAVYPQLHRQLDVTSQFYLSAFGYSRQLITAIAQQQAVAHQWCGLLMLATSAANSRKLANLAANPAYPPELLAAVDASKASELARVSLPLAGLHLPLGGWVKPQQLVVALLDHPLISVQNISTISAIEPKAEGIALRNNGSSSLPLFAAVLVATGGGELPAPLQLPLSRIRGQVSYPPASAASSALAKVICHNGYLTPALAGRHAMGSSFVRDFTHLEFSDAEDQANLEQQQTALGPQPWLQELKLDGHARVSVRASVADHLPIAGCLKAEPRIGLLLGLGSRGLTSAPLLAELLVAQLLGEPSPLGQQLRQALAPERYLTQSC